MKFSLLTSFRERYFAGLKDVILEVPKERGSESHGERFLAHTSFLRKEGRGRCEGFERGEGNGARMELKEVLIRARWELSWRGFLVGDDGKKVGRGRTGQKFNKHAKVFLVCSILGEWKAEEEEVKRTKKDKGLGRGRTPFDRGKAETEEMRRKKEDERIQKAKNKEKLAKTKNFGHSTTSEKKGSCIGDVSNSSGEDEGEESNAEMALTSALCISQLASDWKVISTARWYALPKVSTSVSPTGEGLKNGYVGPHLGRVVNRTDGSTEPVRSLVQITGSFEPGRIQFQAALIFGPVDLPVRFSAFVVRFVSLRSASLLASLKKCGISICFRLRIVVGSIILVLFFSFKSTVLGWLCSCFVLFLLDFSECLQDLIKLLRNWVELVDKGWIYYRKNEVSWEEKHNLAGFSLLLFASVGSYSSVSEIDVRLPPKAYQNTPELGEMIVFGSIQLDLYISSSVKILFRKPCFLCRFGFVCGFSRLCSHTPICGEGLVCGFSAWLGCIGLVL